MLELPLQSYFSQFFLIQNVDFFSTLRWICTYKNDLFVSIDAALYLKMNPASLSP